MFCGGLRSAAAPQFVAILYWCLCYLCWAMVLRRSFGRNTFVWFSVLFLVAPAEQVRLSLYLEGSHSEASALVALAFLLALHPRTTRLRYAFFLSVGGLFFLYKGLVLAFLVLIPWATYQLRTWKERCIASISCLLGFVPLCAWSVRYGFHGHHFVDGDANNPTPQTWFELFTSLRFRSEAIGTPPATLSFRPVTEFPDRLYNYGASVDSYGVLYTCCLCMLSSWVLLVLVRGRPTRWLRHHAPPVFARVLPFGYLPRVASMRPSEATTSLSLVLSYCWLYWLFMATSTMSIEGRYYAPLYPLMTVVIAIVLGRLSPRYAILAAFALLALIVPSTLALWV